MRPQTNAAQAKGRIATSAKSRDVVTISVQAQEAAVKQETKMSSAAPINSVSGGRADSIIGAVFTSFAEEFSKVTEGYADTIREYYAAEHEENLAYDDPSTHIWDKYKNPGSPCFRSDLSEDERAWAYDYEQELLRGGKHLQIRNPYAFADAGNPPTLADAAMQAIQACREQIEQSIQDFFAENRIETPSSFRLSVSPSDYSIHVTGLEDEELSYTIEQALNQGNNGKNLYDYLKLAYPDSGEVDVAFEDGHLPAVDPQQELSDETLTGIRNQTSPGWARYNDYDPHKGPLGTMANPLGGIERIPEEEDRINAGIRMSAPEAIAQFKAMPQQALQMNWWEKFGEEGGMPGDEIYRIAKETCNDTYVQRMVDRRGVIESYYAKAHAETIVHANAMALKNHSDPFTEALDYIAQKYLWPPDLEIIKLNQPESFRRDMSEEERRIAYDQERRLLFGIPVTLNDPYALASVGGVPHIKDE